MKILVLVFAFVAQIFAANLLSMSVNENSDSVEINMSFDAIFDGTIEQNATEKNVTLKISGISIDTKKDLSLSQNLLISRALLTKDGATGVYLTFETKKEIAFEALKNNDGYKLQLKVIAKPAVVADANGSVKPLTANEKPIPQADSEVSWRYIVVVTFLAFLVALMFYIRKKFAKPNGKDAKAGWLLPKGFKAEAPQEDVNVITQSFLDPNNKLMLVEYNNIKYLLLVGNTNVVVDRYYAEDADTQGSDFKQIMAENERKLAEFLKPDKQISNFDEYRTKAEGDF
jgi:hypothetical protein